MSTAGRSKLATAIRLCVFCAFVLCLNKQVISQVEQDPDGTVQKRNDETIEDQQKRILINYADLEQKLLVLREFEQENNPARSRLLKRAYEMSQEQGTTDELKQIVALLTSEDLRNAEKSQRDVLGSMQRLLTLLESEDRGKRIQDELKRNQKYLKEVERLLRIQRSLRGQVEGKADGPRISKSQGQAADRAKKLADEIRKNEEQAKETDAGDSNGDPDAEPKEGGPAGKPKPGQGDSKGGGESGEPSESDPDSESGESGEANPVRKRVAAAEQKMREAKKKLDQAKRDESVKEMNVAIRELEAARKELEEILRQLREEEVERTLAGLETRFRKMMEREIKVRDQTMALDEVQPEQRLADFEIRAGKISAEQTSIATEASRALLLLREDGTSVAFPQTVAEMKTDMEQVASRLSASRVGQTTIEIENDIVETLGYLVDALAKAQKEQDAKRKQSPGSGGGSPGESSLIGQIAEIRMLRSLQDRIYRRHSRYAKMLTDPNDLVGQSEDPEIRSALERLTDRQRQLTEITKEIVESINDQ